MNASISAEKPTAQRHVEPQRARAASRTAPPAAARDTAPPSTTATSAAPSTQLAARPERAVEAAAERQEDRVADRLRLAVGDQERGAAERHQAAQRDHERGHAKHRRQPALVQADRAAPVSSPASAGRYPVPALRVHQERDQHADEAQHRADRQVDLARHDDQRDRRRDDAHHRRLLRDVVEVLRRQEGAGR